MRARVGNDEGQAGREGACVREREAFVVALGNVFRKGQPVHIICRAGAKKKTGEGGTYGCRPWSPVQTFFKRRGVGHPLAKADEGVRWHNVGKKVGGASA
jgi:hypothetical protein